MDRGESWFKMIFSLHVLRLVYKPQTISSQTDNHFVKNGRETAEPVCHMWVDFENGTKNGVEETFAEIRDEEWILKKQWFLRFKVFLHFAAILARKTVV